MTLTLEALPNPSNLSATIKKSVITEPHTFHTSPSFHKKCPEKDYPCSKRSQTFSKFQFLLPKWENPLFQNSFLLRKQEGLRGSSITTMGSFKITSSLLQALPSFITTTEAISRTEGFEISIRCSFCVDVWVASEMQIAH